MSSLYAVEKQAKDVSVEERRELRQAQSAPVLAHDRRRILHFNVTAQPTAEWTARQLLGAFSWDHAPRYLLRDRDSAYGRENSARWRNAGAFTKS